MKDASEYKQRTDPQNRSLHKWCTELANKANEQGKGVSVFVKQIDVEVTPNFVKRLVQLVGLAKYGKEHTSHMTTVELVECCKEVDKMFLEEGIDIPFPSLEKKDFVAFYDTHAPKQGKDNYQH